MSDRSAIPVIRLKLPCSGELEFRERFAPRYAAGGIFIPSDKRRDPGSHVRLIVEFNDKTGAHLSGEAVVTSHLELGGKKGMKLRFLSLDPDSVPFELAPGEPGEGEVTGSLPHPQGTTPLELELFSGQEPLPDTSASRPLEVRSKPVTLRVKDSPRPPAQGHDLDPSEFELLDPPQPASRPREASRYQELFGPDDFARAPAAASPSARSATPRGATQARPEQPSSKPASRPARRGRLWLRVLLLLVAAGVAVELVLAWPDIRDKLLSGEQGMQSPADSELQLADTRAEEGRLIGSGGDAALDHLLRARQLAPPGDRRVHERLVLLADKLQALAAVALSRGNLSEATAHINAALQADPARSDLEDQLARVARERSARKLPSTGSAAAGPAISKPTSPPAAPPAPHSAP